MTNLEFYKEDLIRFVYRSENKHNLEYTIFQFMERLGIRTLGVSHENENMTALNWLVEEYREEILFPDEKEYLYDVQETLAITIKSIRKQEWDNKTEYIQVIYYTGLEQSSISLPAFKANERFKKLEIGELYTAEELGL